MKQVRATVTVLAENTARGMHVIGEHGLSLWVETDDTCLLFDTGQGMALPHNTAALGIDIGRAHVLVLSHGHNDHTGGLAYALAKAPHVWLAMHPSALLPHGSYRNGKSYAIGLSDEGREAVQARHDVVMWTTKPTEVAPGLFVTGAVPRVSGFEDTGGPFYLDPEGTVPDLIEDDQALWIDGPEGLTVILGCAHAGVVNTLNLIRSLNPGRPFQTVIGGMHLGSADQVRMDKTVAALRAFDIQRLMPIHCTGFAAAARLWQAFPGRVAKSPVGSRIKV